MVVGTLIFVFSSYFNASEEIATKEYDLTEIGVSRFQGEFTGGNFQISKFNPDTYFVDAFVESRADGIVIGQSTEWMDFGFSGETTVPEKTQVELLLCVYMDDYQTTGLTSCARKYYLPNNEDVNENENLNSGTAPVVFEPHGNIGPKAYLSVHLSGDGHVTPIVPSQFWIKYKLASNPNNGNSDESNSNTDDDNVNLNSEEGNGNTNTSPNGNSSDGNSNTEGDTNTNGSGPGGANTNDDPDGNINTNTDPADNSNSNSNNNSNENSNDNLNANSNDNSNANGNENNNGNDNLNNNTNGTPADDKCENKMSRINNLRSALPYKVWSK